MAFPTKGDNCPEADAWKVPENAVLGKIVSIEHANHSSVLKKTTAQNQHSRAVYPDISPPRWLPTWFLIIGSSS